MKRLTIYSVAIVFLLAGCMLPNEQRVENQVPYADQMASVQAAIDQFQEETGVLPIKTFDESTNLYQRYVIDFRQLIPTYMQDAPGSSFENGGVYQYVLVNVEEEPEVKVIDVRIMNEINTLTQRINDYRREHTYAPIKESLDYDLFTLDFEALGYKEEPYIDSPYNQTRLPLLYTNSGDIMIDYRLDLIELQSEMDGSFTTETDLRTYLYEDAPFVPVFSVPYTYSEADGIQYDTKFYENE
ncbi:hypothetical protein EH196_10245 [Bacillus sp. C1-1]|nr:hypothetical protein EH196_10245 [Bacillus sp. C1-1]